MRMAVDFDFDDVAVVLLLMMIMASIKDGWMAG
jgi:hypothetical protein